jgi:hypothetical protein
MKNNNLTFSLLFSLSLIFLVSSCTFCDDKPFDSEIWKKEFRIDPSVCSERQEMVDDLESKLIGIKNDSAITLLGESNQSKYFDEFNVDLKYVIGASGMDYGWLLI